MPSRPEESAFWLRKGLDEMSCEQWESLCDGCGQCCRFKLEDADTGEVVQTDVACRLLDLETCRCSDYGGRQAQVPECVDLTPAKIASLDWLPETCGYRLVAAGKDLPAWHPLVSGDPETVHAAGISVRGKVRSEKEIRDVQKVLAHRYGLDLAE